MWPSVANKQKNVIYINNNNRFFTALLAFLSLINSSGLSIFLSAIQPIIGATKIRRRAAISSATKNNWAIRLHHHHERLP